MIKLFKILLIIIFGFGGIYYSNFITKSILNQNETPTVSKINFRIQNKINKKTSQNTETLKKIEEPKKDKIQKPLFNEKLTEQQKIVKKEVTINSPIKGPEEIASTTLTNQRIFNETNIQRQLNGVAPLKINSKLMLAAKNKVDDMFTRQYFEHISPTGEGPDHLAKVVEYNYLMVGENLALGNYKNNKTLLEAWMNSPGHRANILNPKYKEIGIAVKQGEMHGLSTWLAVQEFGRPASDCLLPSDSLKKKIQESKELTAQLKQQITNLYNEINNMVPKAGQLYNEKINTYNILITEYNSFIKKIKTFINDYNNQVTLYNNCVQI